MGISLPSQRPRRLVSDEQRSRSGATGMSSDTAWSLYRTVRQALQEQAPVSLEYVVMRQARQEAWDAGAAEASYGFASAEEEEKKTECIT